VLGVVQLEHKSQSHQGAGMIWIDWVLVAWLSLGVICTVLLVGEPRRPITGGLAAWSVLINGALIAVFIMEHTA
jgi:hypothetical protein